MNWKISSEANGEAISPWRVTTRIAPWPIASSKRAQARQLKIGIEALPERFHDDRKIGELADDLKQVLGAQPLQPERRSLRGIGPRHEQRAGRVLAEP